MIDLCAMLAMLDNILKPVKALREKEMLQKSGLRDGVMMRMMHLQVTLE